MGCASAFSGRFLFSRSPRWISGTPSNCPPEAAFPAAGLPACSGFSAHSEKNQPAPDRPPASVPPCFPFFPGTAGRRIRALPPKPSESCGSCHTHWWYNRTPYTPLCGSGNNPPSD